MKDNILHLEFYTCITNPRGACDMGVKLGKGITTIGKWDECFATAALDSAMEAGIIMLDAKIGSVDSADTLVCMDLIDANLPDLFALLSLDSSIDYMEYRNGESDLENAL